jgi:hypothetical protein
VSYRLGPAIPWSYAVNETTFGDIPGMPECARNVFIWLCHDVMTLHEKVRLYMTLYGTAESTQLLDETARGAFLLIQEAIQDDLAMSFGRLLDPATSHVKDDSNVNGEVLANISFAALANRLSSPPKLIELIREFRIECAPVERHRNKRVGHNDLNTSIHPAENPLPDVGRDQMNRIMALAAQVLRTAAQPYADQPLVFPPVMLTNGDVLLSALRDARQHRADKARQGAKG